MYSEPQIWASTGTPTASPRCQSLAVITICSHVLFPAFSRISDDSSRFRAAFLRALGWIWFAALPVGALSVVVGEPVVVLLLGEEWRAAGAATAAMAGIGLGVALLSVTAEAIKGAGRSSLLNWLTALGLGLGLPLVVLLLPFGLVGSRHRNLGQRIWSSASSASNSPASVVGASRRETAACLWPTTLSAAVAFAVVLPLERFVVRSDHYPVLPGLAWIVVECMLFALVYIGALRLISPSRYRSVRDVVGRALAKVAAGICSSTASTNKFATAAAETPGTSPERRIRRSRNELQRYQPERSRSTMRLTASTSGPRCQ